MNRDRHKLDRAIENSRVGSTRRAIGRSGVVATVRSLSASAATAVRNSFVYRWLTKDPDPDVIVIDLRETRTVGPVLAALDWGLRRIAPYWRSSQLRRGLERLSELMARAADTRLGRWLGRVLEPPESPDGPESDE